MSNIAKAHGMDGTLVEPDWAPLTLDELRRALMLFPEAGEPIRILSTSPRPFSAASVLATSSGTFFVKRHHRSLRDVEGLGEEHRFMQHLRKSGAKVPRVLKACEGGTAVELGDWTYEVHEKPQGMDLYEEALSWTPFRAPKHAYSAGQALARLHCAAADFKEPARKARPLIASFSIFASTNPERAMKRYLAARPVLDADDFTHSGCAAALDLLAPFHEELRPLLPALDPIWTHNDLHASNLFWSDATDDATATAVIDFGLADYTNAVHDLAQAIERNIVEWLVLMQHPAATEVPVHWEHLYALLDGYESIRPLSEQEAAALAPMTALCHAEFALTEADYFLSVLHAPKKAKLASDDYLVGHAQWFRSRAGQVLTDALRQWAAKRALAAREVTKT